MSLKSFFFILLLTVSFASFGQTKTNLKKIETFYDNAKTKIWQSYFEDSKTPYLRQGLYREWDANGNLVTKATYKNNKLNGLKELYFPGSDAKYVNSSENYKDDVLEGESVYYAFDNDEDGNPILKSYRMYIDRFYSKGIATKETIFYVDKTKREIDYTHGIEKGFYPSGKVSDIAYFKKVLYGKPVDDSLYTEFYESGQIKYQGTICEEGFNTGEWKGYYESGKLKDLETWECRGDNHQHQLTAIHYNEDGTERKE